MNRRRKLYEGKAKILYEGPEPGTLIQHFKDDATAFNAKKHDVIEGKGVLNNRISEHVFLCLEELVHEVEIIPVEVVVRNIAAGSIAKRLGLKEGDLLPGTIVEYYYKSDKLDDPMIVEDHITAFGWASSTELDEMVTQALRINDYLSGLFRGVGIRLVDFKIEFGRHVDPETDEERILLADEISPDGCRLWDINTSDRLDKDRFRQDLGGLVDAYQEVARRLGILNPHEGVPKPAGPRLVASRHEDNVAGKTVKPDSEKEDDS